MRVVGVAAATELCQDLMAGGVSSFHFYTLNRSTATREIYANLGLGPEPDSARFPDVKSPAADSTRGPSGGSGI